MAIDHARETRRTSKQVEILSASTSNTNPYLSDQLVHQLGTARRSEIIGKIGDTGQTYQQILNDYLDTL